MNNDYSKRGYLLPEGFKDLIDVLKLKGKTHHRHQTTAQPYFNLTATQKTMLISAKIPGLGSGDLEITVEGKTMRISGKLATSTAPFESVIEVPAEYDLVRACAAYFAGELRITVPML